jgi:hypothetical protein
MTFARLRNLGQVNARQSGMKRQVNTMSAANAGTHETSVETGLR